MCRLFAFSFPKHSTQELRVTCIDAFRELARSGNVFSTSLPGHADGWGIAVYKEDSSSPSVYKSLSSGADDRDFDIHSFIEEGKAESGIAHLRKKTVGELALPNTHPFISGKYSFIHNGTIASDRDVYHTLAPSCEGSTDSERLFRKFLEIKKSNADKEELSTLHAYLEMIMATKKEHPEYSAINTILHDGDNLYVSRVINLERGDHTKEVLENYYTLYIGTTICGGTIVASEALSSEIISSQTLLPNNSLSVISLMDGSLRTYTVL